MIGQNFQTADDLNLLIHFKLVKMRILIFFNDS